MKNKNIYFVCQSIGGILYIRAEKTEYQDQWRACEKEAEKEGTGCLFRFDFPFG